MPRILLVDDDEYFRKMLRMKLTVMGYEVVEACDGKEAVTVFEKANPDVVMTDLIMPEKEGLETIKELKQKNPAVKIIAMSAGGRVNATDYLWTAKSMGAHFGLAKPFSNLELTAALEKLLGGPPPGAPNAPDPGGGGGP